MKTLNNLSDLKESKFGRPPPKHGLLLLWWFAHECVRIDFNSRMVALCDPRNGAFGFHRFYNRENLLPYTNLLYYEVGNLKNIDSLPEYVTEKYTGYIDNSNTDRIIVLFSSRGNRYENIYVTQHLGLLNFDQNHTYCISIELMKDIKGLSREEFLNPHNPSQYVSIDMSEAYPHVPARLPHTPQPRTPQPITHTPQPRTHTPQPHTHTPQPVQSEACLSRKCCCMLICILIVLLIIAAVILWFKFK